MNIFTKLIYSLTLILIIVYHANSADTPELKQHKSGSLVSRYQAIVANLKDNPNQISYNPQVIVQTKKWFKNLGIDTDNAKKYGYESIIISSYLRPDKLTQEIIEQIALAQVKNENKTPIDNDTDEVFLLSYQNKEGKDQHVTVYTAFSEYISVLQSRIEEKKDSIALPRDIVLLKWNLLSQRLWAIEQKLSLPKGQ